VKLLFPRALLLQCGGFTEHLSTYYEKVWLKHIKAAESLKLEIISCKLAATEVVKWPLTREK
jgi:hypothetical protein